MDRQAWLEERRRGIGGSDIAAVCGLSRWKGPMDVYLDKIGATPELEQNEAMYWGTKLEGLLRERFQEEHPDMHVIGHDNYDEAWADTTRLVAEHPQYPFARANYDGLLLDDLHLEPFAGWEGKTASAYKRDEWAGDTPPLEYVYQCQWYMFVSGLPVWYLSVLIGGNDYREWVIERDDVVIEMLLNSAVAFWTLVETRTPPPIDGSDASKRVLNSLYPAEDAVLDPPLMLDEGDDLAARYVAARAALKEAEGTVTAIENELKALVGSHAVAMTPGGFEVDWKPRARTSIDTKRLREAHPEIASEFSKTTEYRAFSVKGPGGSE